RDMRSGQDVRMLAGRYELREEIARGGMGVVWRAEDTVLGRPVAVKEVFPPPAGRNGDRTSAQRRVLREARAAAALHHPGIVTVFDVVHEGDNGFIVMELAESPSLEAVVQEHGPLPVPRAVDVAREAAEILRPAHAHGITPRHVTPGTGLL